MDAHLQIPKTDLPVVVGKVTKTGEHEKKVLSGCQLEHQGIEAPGGGSAAFKSTQT